MFVIDQLIHKRYVGKLHSYDFIQNSGIWWTEGQRGKHNQAEGTAHIKLYAERRHGEFEGLKESHYSCN